MYNPTDRKNCDEALFGVKEELDEGAKGAKGAEGSEYETFCNPTNREECGELLLKLEVKEEPNDNFESEAWVENMIKQDECVQRPELETFCDPTKGQIISECPLEILDFPKIPRKI